MQAWPCVSLSEFAKGLGATLAGTDFEIASMYVPAAWPLNTPTLYVWPHKRFVSNRGFTVNCTRVIIGHARPGLLEHTRQLIGA